MKKKLALIGQAGLLLASCALSGAALANPELAKARNCLACHTVSHKVVGPAFKDVAARYAGQNDAEEKLVKKVMHGSRDTWGPVPMPGNAQVSEAEAHVLVKWVLGLK
ncbi:MAG: c-type cytochrome [Janthinobacterium lividum]